MPPPPSKKQKLSDSEESAANNKSDDDTSNATDVVIDSDSDGSSANTDAEIEALQTKKSRQTSKRKLRATNPSKFGATLQHLLSTDAPSALPLSLKPSIARKHNHERLEQRARKVLQVEKKEKEDKGRITDVIGGWGGESERALRKVAQRGVVKLFNVIQQSQANALAVDEEKKAARGTGKPTLPAPSTVNKSKGKGKNRDNIIGRGKESTVDKDSFFDMIKSGSIVSKA